MSHDCQSPLQAIPVGTRSYLVVVLVTLCLLAGTPAQAQDKRGLLHQGDSPISLGIAAPDEEIGDDGCQNPAAVCIPDGIAYITFTATGSAQCQWNYTINWGDGSPTESFSQTGPGQQTASHHYQEVGEYTAVVRGSGSPSNCVFTPNDILFEVPCTMAKEEYGDLPRASREISVFNGRALTYHAMFDASFSAGWRLCPNASVQFTATGIRFPLEDGGEAASVNAEWTGIKMRSIYPIDVESEQSMPDYGFDPEPYFEVTWQRSEGTRGQALALHLDGEFTAHWTLYPDQIVNMTVCVAVIASGALAIGGAGAGSTAVGGALRTWIQGLRIRYPGIVPVPGAPAPAPGTITLAPEGAPGGVLADIALVFGESFVEHAVVDTLLVDGTEKAPGEAINYSASGLTPGGDVLLILARTTAPDTFHTQELVADGTGSVAGQISLPSDAASGHWLITAVDLQPMRAALQDYTDNNASGDVLVFPLAANSVVVPDWNYLPAFSR